MNKILIICENYPSASNLYSMAFVHSRNIEYLKQGREITVLNFSADQDYVFEGIEVKAYNSLKSIDLSIYNAIVSHAPNIRNHIKFLFPRMKKVSNLIFIFHGHEILKINEYYPKPYKWEKHPSFLGKSFQRLYDYIKLNLLRLFINTYSKCIKLVFVSEWMKENGLQCLGKVKTSKIFVVNNSLNTSFLENSFNISDEKLGDFITIRPLNGSKYAVDLVIDFAKNNPDYNFSIYGQGDFFKYNALPKNVHWNNRFLSQKDIPIILNKYKYAIMPTRLDAQGVMMCEIAAYGMPIIISDLSVCREMLGGFSNCLFIKNEDFGEVKFQGWEMTSFDSNKSKYIDKFHSTRLSKLELDIFDINN